MAKRKIRFWKTAVFRFVEFNFFEDFFEIEKRNMLCILTAVIVILTAAHGIL